MHRVRPRRDRNYCRPALESIIAIRLPRVASLVSASTTQTLLRHLTLVMAKMGGISKIKVQLFLVVAMKSDSEIERDVKDELEWDPDLDSTDIAVSVKGGVVALSGLVPSFTDKYEAETAAKRVCGVSGMAVDLEVRLPNIDERPDPDVARDAAAAVKSQLPVSAEMIKTTVRSGWLSLEGTVEWQYQRATAETAVCRIKGVKSVDNLIKFKLEPRIKPDDVKRNIQEAFRRNAQVDADHVTVEANGGEVILKGTVRSWIERDEAERVAWSAPGVSQIEDHIIVSP
jgi:osmotically-inducible protein OsmY